ncbi:Glycolate permease GlcA [Sporotomaculum syntrophicum]|uniref:L-lactate permease n=1 Tax=Sporotomaculum syntrophicum TaxID=182264 RepID=A0A9D2WS95_9FIRM|nr:L-lactate permease [Sporotomaculum syntrophicum]KAF1085672.1 Glycolate permease GlcA [Sporotomaculum syntrophicum]
MGFLIFLTLLPILVIVYLMVRRQMAADISGTVGWVLTIIIALMFFNTSLEVSLKSSLAGFISSFPISLMVFASIFQITFMQATGALQRIVVFIKTLAPTDKAVQIMLLNVGAGTLLVSIGATPVSILPPILVAMGYTTFVAVALPAIGYDALCTYAMLGSSLVIIADLTGTPLVESAKIISLFLPVISTVIGIGMLYIVGKFNLVKKGLVACVLAGVTNGSAAIAMSHIPFLSQGVVLTGVVAGMCTILVMLVYLKLTGQPIIDRSRLTKEDLNTEKEMSLLKAMSPWLILISILLVINFYKPIFDLLFNVFATPISIIPDKIIKTRLLWNAYTWVFISTILSFIVLKPSGKAVKTTFHKWLARAPRPTFAAGVFFATAFVFNNSGMQDLGTTWEVIKPNSNMIAVLAQASANTFGPLYPFISAFLGLFGGFVSGSEASTIAMFAKYHQLTSEMLKVNALIVIAATAIGGGLASVISPAKLQNAAATIDALGLESQVIKTAFVISVILTSICAIMAMLLI